MRRRSLPMGMSLSGISPTPCNRSLSMDGQLRKAGTLKNY